jgi:serine/threonine protein kinase
VAKLLTIDPEKRPSAEEALEHPWILSGFNLTEEDLKYPPEE